MAGMTAWSGREKRGYACYDGWKCKRDKAGVCVWGGGGCYSRHDGGDDGVSWRHLHRNARVAKMNGRADNVDTAVRMRGWQASRVVWLRTRVAVHDHVERAARVVGEDEMSEAQ
jgi:hypothetical protein